MIALTGVRLHKLDRAGNVLADFDTPVSDLRPAGARMFSGPYDPAISPDGLPLQRPDRRQVRLATFAPDGRRIAWADGAGVSVADVPDFGAGCTMEGATLGKTLIPGGSQPDWDPRRCHRRARRPARAASRVAPR